MLVIMRRPGETIVINEDIYLKILGIKGNQVSIGIDADREIPVHREEVQRRIIAERLAAQHDSN